ncbi:MAG: type IV secretory system conjugative DNA transfer family protein [Cyclobacteriaceae bacterium]
MKQTGESQEGLRKVNDCIRALALWLLSTHVYHSLYGIFALWGMTHPLAERYLRIVDQLFFIHNPFICHLFIVITVLMTALGMSGRKRKPINIVGTIGVLLLATGGMLLGPYLLSLPIREQNLAILYISEQLFSFLLLMYASTRIHRHMNAGLGKDDPFNDEQEAFPQQQEKMVNGYSHSFRTRFYYKGKKRKGWVNLLNPFRATLVMGIQGSGKTYSVIIPLMKTFIEKGYPVCVYDWKYPDLSEIAYNHWQAHPKKYPKNTKFCVLNFDDPKYSHRCNPLQQMDSVEDAVEISTTLLLNINRSWINKRGDFFVESPINFFAAILWYLKLKTNQHRRTRPFDQQINYCTLAHAIELMCHPPTETFRIIAAEGEVTNLISPFVESLKSGALEQLQGMVDSAKIGLTRLSNKNVYWTVTGNDFSLDFNNPEEPKIIVIGNNPRKSTVYSSYVGLYMAEIMKTANQKHKLPSGIFLDEMPTIYASEVSKLVTTGRSNMVACCMGVQDMPQIRSSYARELAESMISIVGNIFVGTVQFDSAKKISDALGKNKQIKTSITHNADVSRNVSTQMDTMIPASKIAQLPQGHMVGLTSDNHDQVNPLKVFHAEFLVDAKKIQQEEKRYKPLPEIYPSLTWQQEENVYKEVEGNFYTIQNQIVELIEEETAILDAYEQQNEEQTITNES